MNIHDFRHSLINQLIARKGDWQEIAKCSGVSYSWLSKFSNGHIPNPGLATLSKLSDFLNKRS